MLFENDVTYDRKPGILHVQTKIFQIPSPEHVWYKGLNRGGI